MAFYIYDPKGYRHPYYTDWREVRKVEETTSSSEKRSLRFDRFADAIKGIRDAPHWKLTKQNDQAIFAKRIMTKNVLTLSPDTPLSDAWIFFCEHRFRHVPILNAAGALVGILSDRKLLEESSSIAHPKNHASDACVKSIMVTHVLTAHPDTDLSMIAKIMINERIGAMPIVDDHRALVGIITRTDIVRTLIKIEDYESKE